MKIKDNKSYKIISFDLDGTLLDDNLEFSVYSKKVLQKIIKKGFICIINSSRTLTNIQNIIGNLNFSYLIALNGSVIFDNIKREIIKYFYINNEIKNKIINFLLKKKLCANIFTHKKPYITYFFTEGINKIYQKSLNPQILDKIPQDNLLSIEIILKNKIELIETKKELIKEFNDYLNIFDSNYYYLEIHSCKIDKFEAVKFLSEKLNINVEQVIAIGDSNTDKVIIQKSGLGIAMKNSSDNILKIADLVTEFDNNNNGAVKYLSKILNIY